MQFGILIASLIVPAAASESRYDQVLFFQILDPVSDIDGTEAVFIDIHGPRRAVSIGHKSAVFLLENLISPEIVVAEDKIEGFVDAADDKTVVIQGKVPRSQNDIHITEARFLILGE